MFLVWTGNEFQAAGPATVNELSASRVLVRRYCLASQSVKTCAINISYHDLHWGASGGGRIIAGGVATLAPLEPATGFMIFVAFYIEL